MPKQLDMPQKTYFIFIIAVFIGNSLAAQDVYYHVSNREVYDFMDELANEKIIEINSVIKPYTRKFIAECLQKAKESENRLTKRQQKDLDFYLRDFGKELYHGKFEHKRFDIFYYNDSLFTFSANLIAGGTRSMGNDITNNYWWNGAEIFSYAGKHLGVYASLRDRHDEEKTADVPYLNKLEGGKYKGAGDHSEMRGGINISWKWGSIGMVKDHIQWGNYYSYPNIFSDKAPSFAQLKLYLKPAKWFEFNYFHGWLVSEIVDSSRSYTYNGVQRDVFHGKYIAANMFTIIPWKGVHFSVGNSIVYSDVNVNPAYLIPIFFYKSVDHTYNGITNTAGQNSQLFLDLSIRALPKVHVFYSMYLDDLSINRMFKENQSNHWSMKGGMRVSNLIPNTFVTIEYTRTNPLCYENDTPTTIFSSNNYKLGHYLQDNAQELYMALSHKPLRGLELMAWYTMAQKGPDYPYIRTRDPETGMPYVHGKKFLTSIEWEQSIVGFSVNYFILNDIKANLSIEKYTTSGELTYTHEMYQGDPIVTRLSLSYGF